MVRMVNGISLYFMRKLHCQTTLKTKIFTAYGSSVYLCLSCNEAMDIRMHILYFLLLHTCPEFSSTFVSLIGVRVPHVYVCGSLVKQQYIRGCVHVTPAGGCGIVCIMAVNSGQLYLRMETLVS